MFHSIEVFIQRCIEMMKVDKKQNRLWAKRMHTSIKCYKENLMTLFVLEKKLAQLEESPTNQVDPSEKLDKIDTNTILENSDDEMSNLDGINGAFVSSTQKTNKQNESVQQQTKKMIDEKTSENLAKIKSNRKIF